MVGKRTKKISLALFLGVATSISLHLGYLWRNRFSLPALGEEVDRQLQRFELQRLTTTAKTSTGSLTTTSISPHVKHRTFLITKRPCMQNYDLLVITSSAPSNFERRNTIRKTWAFERAFQPRWTTVFLVAQTRDEVVSDALLKEDEAHKDLVRASYYEHYWNQTRKIQMGFEWAVTYCNFSFLLKVDDDVFVHIPRVLSFLSSPNTPEKKLYAGNHYTNNTPFRGGKWKVTYEEYNLTKYPDFCPGFGYILSQDVVSAFVDTFSFLPFFRLDDVYVGMLADKNGITVTNNKGFEVWHPRNLVCVPTNYTLVRHDVGEECQMKMFKTVLFPE
ncbi:beta-1,3-galactosyltransferase 1-like [Acropora muricata]|uniref:beta-1,3-galactosyltransferase 1-like n=1 Tax=Acropora muricata TaxID=159855 RepID=UPI0034E6168F